MGANVSDRCWNDRHATLSDMGSRNSIVSALLYDKKLDDNKNPDDQLSQAPSNDIPTQIIQRIRTNDEIQQIKIWSKCLANKPSDKSVRGMLWSTAIGNDLDILSDAYNNYDNVNKNQIDDYDIKHNSPRNYGSGSGSAIKSIFPHKNSYSDTMSFCEGVKRKDSILRDVTRMYTYSVDSINDNMDPSYKSKIESVLMAFCNYNKHISYTQFMTHLVQILLKYQSPQNAFISLSNMLNVEIFDIFINFNMDKLNCRMNIFYKILRYNCINLFNYLNSLSMMNHTLSAYVMECVQSLFSIQLEENIVIKIWDLYFIHGEVIIWKTCVALLMILNDNLFIIKGKLNSNEITIILQSIDKSLINVNDIYFMNKVNSIQLPNDVQKLFPNQ